MPIEAKVAAASCAAQARSQGIPVDLSERRTAGSPKWADRFGKMSKRKLLTTYVKEANKSSSRTMSPCPATPEGPRRSRGAASRPSKQLCATGLSRYCARSLATVRNRASSPRPLHDEEHLSRPHGRLSRRRLKERWALSSDFGGTRLASDLSARPLPPLAPRARPLARPPR